MLREWRSATGRQIPAHEWDFNDVNPPVIRHARAVFEIERQRTGVADYASVERNFFKNAAQPTAGQPATRLGANIFQGGFLGWTISARRIAAKLSPGYLLGSSWTFA
jgi:hypothetical protein